MTSVLDRFCTFLIFYFSPDVKDWRFDRVMTSRSGIRSWLKDYESVGYSHPYEVAV